MIPTSTNISVELKKQLPAAADAVVVLIHKETQAGKVSAGGAPKIVIDAVDRLIASGDVKGKSNELTMQSLAAAKDEPTRVIVIGTGNPAKFSAECLREAGATLARHVRKQKLARVAILLPQLPDELPGVPDSTETAAASPRAVQALTEGLYLGAFEYAEYRGKVTKESGNGAARPVKTHYTLVHDDGRRAVKDALQMGIAVGEGQAFARTIAHRPSNDINPVSLARVAQQMARQVGLKSRILDEKEMARLGMGGITAVGAGSRTLPRMIVLEYAPRSARQSGSGKGQKRAGQTLLLVGKAVTFDTGGISIKPAQGMQKMIFDKCGGMAVLGAMLAIARIKPAIRVVGILSSAENHVSGTAYRPGDILRMYNGVTVEVTNTDAEGRLVLADALAWGCETYKPAGVIELSTLTGGVIVALGRGMAGVMTPDDALMGEVQSAADRAGEAIWRLPLHESMKDLLKSEWADIVNSGAREAHPLQGGLFLSHFVPEGTPWLHMDIAGPADTEKPNALYTMGATGYGVRTLVQWVTAQLG